MTKIPILERVLAAVGALAAIIQAMVGEWAIGMSVAISTAALVVILYRYRRRLLALDTCVLDEIETYFAKGKYRLVIRWGQAVSRPLWLSGSYQIRVAIGRRIVESARRVEKRATDAEIRALVDDCGWTSVEMGQLELGETWILEGLELARKHQRQPMVAKALRHLAGKYLRARDFKVAAKRLQEAREANNHLPAGPLREELEAEWHYAHCVLALAEGDLPKAAREIAAAEDAYRHLPDKEWQAKIKIRVADIEYQKKDYANALGLFTQAKSLALDHDYRRVLVKARIGAARCSIKTNQLQAARDEINEAGDLVRESDMLLEQGEIAAMRAELKHALAHHVAAE